jgi:hypothetical protein
MDGVLKQSTAAQTRWIGPFVDDTDFKTAETALTIANTDIKISKNGGASASKNSGGGTHDVNGMYAVTWDATDTATVGELKYSIKVAGALPVFGSYVVLEEAVYDELFAASALGYVANAPVNVAQFGGTNLTAAGGRPEVNLSHIAGSAVSTTTAQLGVNVVQISGDATSADNLESYTDGTSPMPVNATQISGDTTAADNAEAFFDGTGYAGTNNVIPLVTTTTNLTNKGDGSGFTAIPWNASWDAEVESEVTDALNSYDPPTKAELDAAVANVSVDEIQATALADLFNTDSGTTYASAVAGSVVAEIADNAGGSALTAAAIADAVWEEALADHEGTVGSTAEALADAGGSGASAADIADAVLDEALSGHTTAGSLGKAIADIETNAAAILVDTGTTLDGKLDTIDSNVDSILADTAVIGTPAGVSIAADIAAIESQTDDIGVAGAGLTAVPWNAAWDAEVQSEVADALAVYDPPTKAELDVLGTTALATQASVDTIDNFIDTEVAAILEDTGTTLDDLVDDLEGRLTAALATVLAAHSLGIGRGVVDASSTTTGIIFKSVNGAAASAVNDFYNGRHIVFTSGALTLQATSITDYDGTTKTATVSATTSAPAEDVTFIIV